MSPRGSSGRICSADRCRESDGLLEVVLEDGRRRYLCREHVDGLRDVGGAHLGTRPGPGGGEASG